MTILPDPNNQSSAPIPVALNANKARDPFREPRASPGRKRPKQGLLTVPNREDREGKRRLLFRRGMRRNLVGRCEIEIVGLSLLELIDRG